MKHSDEWVATGWEATVSGKIETDAEMTNEVCASVVDAGPELNGVPWHLEP